MKAVIALLVITIVLAACKKEADTTPPQLTVPFVNTDLTQRFIPFGEILSSGKENPAYDIYLSDSIQDVIASCGGRVIEVRRNENIADYKIEIEPFEYSVYKVYYYHIKDPVVSQGQFINAGDQIGTIGIGGRTELQIIDIRDGESVCLESFASAGFNAAINVAMTKTNLQNGTSYSMSCTRDKVHP